VGFAVGVNEGLRVGFLVILRVGSFDGRLVGFRDGFMLLVGVRVGATVGGGVGFGGSVNVTVPVMVFELQSILATLIRSVAFNVIIDES
jgi:hypothetical protein